MGGGTALKPSDRDAQTAAAAALFITAAEENVALFIFFNHSHTSKQQLRRIHLKRRLKSERSWTNKLNLLQIHTRTTRHRCFGPSIGVQLCFLKKFCPIKDKKNVSLHQHKHPVSHLIYSSYQLIGSVTSDFEKWSVISEMRRLNCAGDVERKSNIILF